MSLHLTPAISRFCGARRIGGRTDKSGCLVSVRKSRIGIFTCAILSFALSLVAACASSRYETYQVPRTVVASWYGAEFHGRPTASGEKFDMNGLTCAHRELPFGTILQVTNTKNDKLVRCVVNDRGPFVSGRDLDLSYGAAKEIGLKSTGPVRVVLLGREAGYTREVKYVSSSAPYTVQVGSFTERENALRLKDGLELKYKDVYIIEATLKEGTFYRVRIGKFQNRKDAFAQAKAMADEGYSPVIMRYDERA